MTDDNTLAQTQDSKTSEIFDFSASMQRDYKSPLNAARLNTKPWDNVTHGRYKDIFNLNAGGDRGTRRMRMSPDVDFKIDKIERRDDPFLMAEMERRSQQMAKDELKSIIAKQRITLEKNTRLYRAMKQSSKGGQ